MYHAKKVEWETEDDEKDSSRQLIPVQTNEGKKYIPTFTVRTQPFSSNFGDIIICHSTATTNITAGGFFNIPYTGTTILSSTSNGTLDISGGYIRMLSGTKYFVFVYVFFGGETNDTTMVSAVQADVHYRYIIHGDLEITGTGVHWVSATGTCIFEMAGATLPANVIYNHYQDPWDAGSNYRVSAIRVAVMEWKWS